MNSDPWVALFCPNCGYTLNEHELETDDPTVQRRKNAGSLYTCGWCKTRQTDWGHVKRCKATHDLRQKQAIEQAEQGALKLYSTLSAELEE